MFLFVIFSSLISQMEGIGVLWLVSFFHNFVWRELTILRF
jgi:hypothetical protein